MTSHRHKHSKARMVQGNSSKVEELFLDDWSEIIGTILQVKRDSIIIQCSHFCRISLPPGDSRKKDALKKGVAIGVLKLPDGSLRFRAIAGQPYKRVMAA